MQVCTSLQTDNHTSTPPLSFLQAGCPSCCPTNSVKALKAKCVVNLVWPITIDRQFITLIILHVQWWVGHNMSVPAAWIYFELQFTDTIISREQWFSSHQLCHNAANRPNIHYNTAQSSTVVHLSKKGFHKHSFIFLTCLQKSEWKQTYSGHDCYLI